jgi:DNA modification methylase
MKAYFSDDTVTLYHGDCREVTNWLAADILVTDPPYGIGWKRGVKQGRGDAGHSGIQGDSDTSTRDAALSLWGKRPGVVFGSFYAPQPTNVRHILVYRKPPDSGVVGSTTGYRRDVEPVFLVGPWPKRPAAWSSVVASNALGAGHLAGRYGHPHAKPVDVLEALIATCPPGVIADPFAGSGSTLVAARNQGRRAIGIEMEERYCELIAKRLSQGALPFEAAS